MALLYAGEWSASYALALANVEVKWLNYCLCMHALLQHDFGPRPKKAASDIQIITSCCLAQFCEYLFFEESVITLFVRKKTPIILS
jgi:hypothetical protein